MEETRCTVLRFFPQVHVTDFKLKLTVDINIHYVNNNMCNLWATCVSPEDPVTVERSLVSPYTNSNDWSETDSMLIQTKITLMYSGITRTHI